MGQVTESIFSGETVVIPMAEVHHIEWDKREGYEDAISVVLNGTTWNSEIDAYNNHAYLRHEEAASFLQCWCTYRSELEAETITNVVGEMPGFEGTNDTLKALTDALAPRVLINTVKVP